MGAFGQAGLDVVKWRGFRAKKGFASSTKTGLSLGVLAGVFKVRHVLIIIKYFPSKSFKNELNRQCQSQTCIFGGKIFSPKFFLGNQLRLC